MLVADVYATITEADPALVSQIAEVLELRAADPQQQAMRQTSLGDILFPPGARVLEVGCGTGAVTRELATWPGVAEVTGVDPSPTFLAAARGLDPPSNVRFVEGDARALAFEDGSVEVVVFHTTLCHVPGPQVALREAARVLRPGGWLAVFDGDYATATVAVSPADPLQACVDAMVGSHVHDPWLVRRLPGLLEGAGFTLVRMRSYGYVETRDARYIPTILESHALPLGRAEGRRLLPDPVGDGHPAKVVQQRRSPEVRDRLGAEAERARGPLRQGGYLAGVTEHEWRLEVNHVGKYASQAIQALPADRAPRRRLNLEHGFPDVPGPDLLEDVRTEPGDGPGHIRVEPPPRPAADHLHGRLRAAKPVPRPSRSASRTRPLTMPSSSRDGTARCQPALLGAR